MSDPAEQGSESDGRVARRAGWVALGTLGSRALGMVREMVVAATFHVGATDAFFIAFTIPNTFRQVLGEGAVANAFVPAFTEARARGREDGKRFLAGFSGALLTMLVLATLAGVLAADGLAWLYAGGFREDVAKMARTVSLTRGLFPYLLLAGLAALATGALNVLGRFAAPAFVPALLNVSMIACALLVVGPLSDAGLDPIFALVAGALLGGVLQVVMQLGLLRRSDSLVRPRWGFGDPEVRRALALMLPLLLGTGVYQLNILLSRLFASHLAEGSQSYLSYGMRVVEIPQGVFAMALASAALPSLSRLRSEAKHEELLSLFRYSLRITLFIAVPASVALVVLAEPIAAVLFGRGAFTPNHVLQTARSLLWQGAGVWAVACVRVLVPMFAAHRDTRTPVQCSALNLITFVGLSLALMGPYEHAGLAAANTVAAAVQVGALVWMLRRKLGPLGLSEVAGSLLRIGLAAAAMAGGLSVAREWLDWHETAEWLRAGAMLVLVAAGALAYIALAALLRSPELRELLGALRRRTTAG